MLLYVMIYYSYQGQSTLFLSTRREPVIFIHFVLPSPSDTRRKAVGDQKGGIHEDLDTTWDRSDRSSRSPQISTEIKISALQKTVTHQDLRRSRGQIHLHLAALRHAVKTWVLWENLPETMGLPMKYGGKACKIVPPLGNSEERALTTRRVIQKYMNHCESSSQRCLKLTEIPQRPNQNHLQNLSRAAFWLFADHFSRHFFAGPNSVSKNHISFRC